MKIVTLLSALFFCSLLWAQNNLDYDFSVSTSSYQNIQNPVPLSGSQYWDDPTYKVPLGFDLKAGPKSYSTIQLESDVLITTGNLFSNDSLLILQPLNYDLEARTSANGGSVSPISYKTTGSTGNRILKMEWRNAGFWDGDPAEFINFQIWIMEADNSIEFHFGPQNITSVTSENGDSGPLCLFAPLVQGGNNPKFISLVYTLKGNPSAPELVKIKNPGPNTPTPEPLNSMPPDGTVYRFEPSSLSLKQQEKQVVSIYPNPTTDFLNIESTSPIQKLEVFNMLGEKLMKKRNAEIISVEKLEKGVYFLKVKTAQGNSTRRFIKN